MTDIIHHLNTPSAAMTLEGSAAIIDRLHQALDAVAAFMAVRHRRTLELGTTRHRLRSSRLAVSRESYRDYVFFPGTVL